MINKSQTDVNRTRQIVRDTPDNDINASIIAQIGELRAQINALYQANAEAALADAGNYDTDNNTDGFVPWANTETIMINNTGEAVPDSALVVEDLTVLNAFKYTTTKNDETVIGVVSNEEIPTGAIGSSTPTGIAIGGQGIITHHGRADVLTDAGYGAINVGDKLIASVRKGYAQVADHPRNPGVFGTAREQLLSGAAAIEVFIEPPRRNTNAADAIQDAFDNLVTDLDGSVTGFSGLLERIDTFRSSDMSVYVSRQYFYYDTSANITSSYFSAYTVGGAGESLMQRTLNYSASYIDNIIQEVSS